MKFLALSKTTLTILGGFALSGIAQAQDARTVYLFNATPGTGTGFQNAATTAPWGNGLIRPTRQAVDYEGASVLELQTRNFAEGARFDLRTPLDLTPFVERGLLRLRLRFQDAVPAAGMGEGGMPGGFPGAMPGGFPGGGIPGRAPGGFGGISHENAPLTMPHWTSRAQFAPPGALPPLGGPGAPGNMGGEFGEGGLGLPVGPLPQSTTITALRVTFVRDNGVMMGRIPVDISATSPNQPDVNGWRLYVLRVRDMISSPNTSGPVRRVLITSDNTDTFFLAQAALVVETGQMTASIRRSSDPAGAQVGEITVRPGPITLVADVEAGAADPVVEWDFDADKDGFLPPPAINGGAATGAMGGEFNPEMGAAPNLNFPRPGVGGGVGGAGRPALGGNFPRPGVTIPQPNPEFGGIEGGATPGQWTGPRIDALGLTATFEYPNEEQNYRVQITVRDKTGQKQPVTASVLVKVRG